MSPSIDCYSNIVSLEQVVSSSKDKMGTTTNKSVTTDLAGLSKNGQKRRKRVKRLVSKMFVEEDGSMG